MPVTAMPSWRAGKRGLLREGLLLLWLALVCCPPSWAGENPITAPAGNVRRFAVVVGANQGGKDRTPLRYAVSDARLFMSLLEKIGGVAPAEAWLLVEPKRQDLLESFEAMLERVARAKGTAKKTELIFYYSGHADEEGALLGGEKVFYKEIRRLLDRSTADVRIAVLDSCSSGAFTRVKGGVMRAPFLQDSAYDMKGYAIMTSSSSDEASQESDRLRSSFFTYYLAAGLRGAADLNQDGRITLNEAYQYAYNETLARTEKTLAGAQHPNYDIQMTGTGDVVMTDIRQSASLLVLDKSVYGRISVRDAGGDLVAELRKSGARDLQLGLEPGDFVLTLDREAKLAEARITLKNNETQIITQDKFKDASRENTRSRGSVEDGPTNSAARPASRSTEGYRVKAIDFSWVPEPEVNQKVIHRVIFNAFGSASAKLAGFAFGPGPVIVKEDGYGFQSSLTANSTGGDFQGIQLGGLYNFAGGFLLGPQVTVGVNVAAGGIKGPQAAGLLNISRGDMQGPQVAVVGNYASGHLEGPQIAGVFNFLEGSMKGPQVAPLFNFARAFSDGVQVTPGFNLVEAECAGVQVASLFNSAQTLSGIQVALLNLSEKNEGFQLGLVNLAKNQTGESVGLLNLSEDSSLDIVGWTDSLTPVTSGVRFRINHFYSLLALGGSDLESNPVPAFYIGGHIPLQNWFLDIDLGALLHFSENTALNASGTGYGHTRLNITGVENASQGRLILGFTPWSHMSLFAGGGFTYALTGQFGIAPRTFQPLFLGGLQFSL